MSRNVRLGMFFVAALAIITLGIFLVGDQQSLFQSNYRVKAEFKNVAGLNEGAEVRVGGVRMGSVHNIALPKRPSDKVVVSMDLAKTTQKILKQDSVAAIKSEGLLGDKYIEVAFGSDESKELRGGETLASDVAMDISDLLVKANGILDTTQMSLNNLQGATGNINDITSKINTGKGTLGAFVNDKTVYTQAAASMTSFREDAEALKSNFLLRGFFNKRGYVDSEELKKHEIPKLPGGEPTKTFTFDTKKVFDNPDTAKMKNEKTFNDAGMYLQNEKLGTVVITAASNMKGDSEKERIISQAQSAAIRNYLVQNFKLDDTRLKTMGLGKRSDSGENGRIQILIYASGAAAANAAANAAKN